MTVEMESEVEIKVKETKCRHKKSAAFTFWLFNLSKSHAVLVNATNAVVFVQCIKPLAIAFQSILMRSCRHYHLYCALLFDFLFENSTVEFHA